MSTFTEEELREIASVRIHSRRDEILREQQEIGVRQVELAARYRELDRELAECRAAARFFNVRFEVPTDSPELRDARTRMAIFYHRARAAEDRGEVAEAAALLERAQYLERQLQNDIEAKRVAAQNTAEEQTIERATPQSANPPLVPKTPRIRDIVLDQLRLAGEGGSKAAPIQNYIESTYSVEIHGKTVGMTLYRLSQEKLVHRKGQTWFYGPPVTVIVPVESKNPGGETPGLIENLFE